MKHIGVQQYRVVIDKIAREIKRDERSLRAICAETMGLDPPERMHHAQLSVIMRGGENRNLYLQQFFVLCKLLGTQPLAFLIPTEDMELARLIAKAAGQLVKIGATERRQLLTLIDQAAINARRGDVKK